MSGRSRGRTISWREPVPDLREFAAVSRLDYLRHALGDGARVPPIGVLLDFRPFRFEHGLAQFREMPPRVHYNNLDTLHSGFAGPLLASAPRASIRTTLTPHLAY